jgi:acyl carrier protein
MSDASGAEPGEDVSGVQGVENERERSLLEGDLKTMIVEALVLEDIAPDDIDSEAPLFVEGLGLDSIDALELAMVLEERYGVKLDEDPDANRAHFASVRSLASFVAANRVK